MNEFGSFYKSIRNRKYNTWCVYTTRLDTYGCGCQHNCKYCYSKSLLSFRGLFNEKYPRVADLYKIKNKNYELLLFTMISKILLMEEVII